MDRINDIQEASKPEVEVKRFKGRMKYHVLRSDSQKTVVSIEANTESSSSDNENEASSDEEATPSGVAFDGLMKKESQGFSPAFNETNENGIANSVKSVFYNGRPLEPFAETYELEKFEKNIMLILNHENLDGYKLPRSGTEADKLALKMTFENLGFKVIIEDDLEREALKETVNQFTSQDFTDYGCVAIVVLTHGKKHGRLRAKDKSYSELRIINSLLARANPSLVTKPRLVIIQACRGKMCTTEIPVPAVAREVMQDDDDSAQAAYSLPAEADLLVLHSSYDEKSSARDPELGSWFIQELCKKINRYSTTLDLESILVHVKRGIAIHHKAYKYNEDIKMYETFKQMPVSRSTLIRQLFLKKYKDDPVANVADDITMAIANTIDRTQTDSTVPTTPMSFRQFTQCSCFLNHFSYIRKCLTFYVAEFPTDGVALNYLNIAKNLREDDNAKEHTAKAICDYLRLNVHNHPMFKCLYYYTHY